MFRCPLLLPGRLIPATSHQPTLISPCLHPKSWRYFGTQNHAPSKTDGYKELPTPVGPLVPYFANQKPNPPPTCVISVSWCYGQYYKAPWYPRNCPWIGASTYIPPRDQHGVAALLPRGAVVALQPVAATVRRGTPEVRPEVGLSEAPEGGGGIAGHLQCKWPGLYQGFVDGSIAFYS